MKRLTDCPVSPEQLPARPPYAAELVEGKGAGRSRAVPRRLASVERASTGQVLELTSDEPLIAYGFPDEGRSRVDFDGARPDGVVLAVLDGRSLVVFIELKSTGKDGKAEHGLKQVRAGVQHFAPVGRAGGASTHGDEHHDAWSRGDDLPPPELVPASDHQVVGIAVVFRALPRELGPPPEVIAGKESMWATVQVPMQGRNRASIELRKLLMDAHVPGIAEAPPRRRGRR